MLSVNEYGVEVFEEMMDLAEELNVEVVELDGGTTVIDAGVNAKGGFEAGLFIARICMADLAEIRFASYNIDDISLPAVEVTTDHPVIACMASQYAGWRVKVGKFFGMGSGPARALSRKPPELYEKIGYMDDAEEAVLVLETSSIPDDAVASKIAEACMVEPDSLYLVVAPTASVAGLVQIAARGVETGVHKFESIGFDINTIKHGHGIVPVSPVVGDDVKCMGTSNDCIIYGGRMYYAVEYENIDELKEYVRKVPSINSRDYGRPFYITFKEAGFDFFKVDAAMFAPAEVTVNELRSGKVLKSGSVNKEVLLQSIGAETP
ncbi:MAG: methenyltetrahydromethanopterin cyclohydrolase [Canidatus Methanoxibalbensis ujae]|nr:methenyltetrahydromethanopterin cyclohydrolase [Candidatus Methanoxibalbensis ujae]MCW7078706.1 methenyltetrahydromethanopterin cyclohydrolase [Candidatus Methanoxibalbensis ujae]